MSGVSKIVTERNQRILIDLVAQPGNDACADCKSKAPRWASHNLGIFICVRCASIHRKIGTHVTKVKSLTLDSWSKEQVENMKSIGNNKANNYWNPDEVRHPPPTNMEESERDSDLEKYIRSKYEYKRFRSLSARAAEQLGASQSRASVPARSHTAPIRGGTSPVLSRSLEQPLLTSSSESQSSMYTYSNLPVPPTQLRSASTDLSTTRQGTLSQEQSQSHSFTPTSRTSGVNPFFQAPAAPPNHQASLTNSTFNDLLSLQGPSSNSSLPLQYQASSAFLPGESSSFASSSLALPSPSPSTGLGGTVYPYTNQSIFGQDSASLLTSVNPFQQSFSAGMPTGTPTTTPPNPYPFGQGYDGTSEMMSGQPQSYISNAFSPQPLQSGTVGNTPFRGNQSPFGLQSGMYQAQQQSAQPMQSNGNFNSSSPYAQQAKQAQQLFQSMASGSNTHGTQWRGPE
ncbi:hypothetical protein EW145_g5286 [Phellinidium pouzarii]|uniref:Arf-GAP domain-containing protein n=1 Tax=Phellinidium pouzarii TaxID=167371 RepID=A0A4S4L1V7_9AGAM|nr:hypothetical protein EW145_g5286 [Phellinidium pouzarii]